MTVGACLLRVVYELSLIHIFMAAMESVAFYERDIRKLIDIGLSYIPEECTVDVYKRQFWNRRRRDMKFLFRNRHTMCMIWQRLLICISV